MLSREVSAAAEASRVSMLQRGQVYPRFPPTKGGNRVNAWHPTPSPVNVALADH